LGYVFDHNALATFLPDCDEVGLESLSRESSGAAALPIVPRNTNLRLQSMPSRIIGLLALAGCVASQASASTYNLITEPDQGLTPIYNLIGSAKSTLDMTMYELTDTQAEQLLAQAASSGVTVRVILDQNLEKSSNTAAYNYLNSHGVQAHWANPKYSATHQKTITVDGTTTAIMTLNLTSQYYTSSRDFALIEDDPNDIAAIEATFDADFNSSTVTPDDGDDLVWSPTNSQSVILSVINSANHSLAIENEEMGDTNVINALLSAAARGVLVQVVMTNTGNNYSAEFSQLVAGGAEVSTYAASAALYIHAKVILADYGSSGAQVFLGSENFSSASLTRNRELGLTLSDAAILQSIAGTLTNDFNGGVPWTGNKAAFSIQANPPAMTVNTGSSKTSTVTTAVFSSFSSTVALAASGLPSGVTANFTPSSIAAPGTGTSTIELFAGASVAAGDYPITITGTGGGLTETAGITLTVVATDVVDTASSQPGFASGAWVTILGTNLSPVTDTWTNSIVNGKLPTALDGVTVTVGGQPAYPQYISPTQINAVAPSVAAGPVSITISAPNQTDTTATAVAQAVKPALFQWGVYAVATHQDFSYAVKSGVLSKTAVPAAPGDVIILWGSGFGPTTPAAPVGTEVPSGTTYNTTSAVTVTLGATPATVYGAALAPGFAALYQVAILIPDSLADGDYPVIATVSGAHSPPNVLLTVLH
jgi:cardiolipin synthase